MESLKAPAPCGLEGSRRHVTDRFRIAPARDATGIAARRAVGPACPASSLRCPQARVCALSCVRTPLNVIETAPIRGTRHREPLPPSGPKAPLRPVCPLPQAHYALNAPRRLSCDASATGFQARPLRSAPRGLREDTSGLSPTCLCGSTSRDVSQARKPLGDPAQPSRGPKVCPVSVVFELKLPQNVALGPQWPKYRNQI
jgi:hypothetical protein